MASLKKYAFRRMSIAGGQAEPVEIRNSGINVVRIINWGTSELRASVASDPETAPMAIVAGNGATNNLMDPAGISRVWVYAEGAVDFGLVEMSVDDPMTILAMESVVANMMTALPAGTAHVGQVGIDVDGTPVTEAAPFPVQWVNSAADPTYIKAAGTGTTTWTGVASGAVKAASGALHGVEVAAAAGAVTVRLRDGGAGGVVRAVLQAVSGGWAANNYPVPRLFATDIYVEIAGTAPTNVVLQYE